MRFGHGKAELDGGPERQHPACHHAQSGLAEIENGYASQRLLVFAIHKQFGRNGGNRNLLPKCGPFLPQHHPISRLQAAEKKIRVKRLLHNKVNAPAGNVVSCGLPHHGKYHTGIGAGLFSRKLEDTGNVVVIDAQIIAARPDQFTGSANRTDGIHVKAIFVKNLVG